MELSLLASGTMENDTVYWNGDCLVFSVALYINFYGV